MEIVRHPFDYYRFPLARGASLFCAARGFLALPARAAFSPCQGGGRFFCPTRAAPHFS